MYNVSSAYKLAMTKPIQRHTVRGSIDNVDFTAEDVLGGSLSINNQICEATAVKLGGVYIGELKLTLDRDFALNSFSRGSWTGKQIEVEFGLELADSSIEFVPGFGAYTIDSATWTESGLDIVAYDNMRKLDKTLSVDQSSASAYDWLAYACEQCGIELGMTRLEVEALPNGTELLGLADGNTQETFRDLVSELAAVLCSFATINRDGALVIKTLATHDPIDTISADKRFSGCSFSDFETYYTGLFVTDNETNTTEYYSASGIPDDGLTMNLGANNFLQLGTALARMRIRQAIIDSLALFRTTPFNSGMLGSIAYDLGDILKFEDGIAGDGVITSIMSYTATVNDYIAQGFGENPALTNAQSKNDKDLNGIRNQTTENEVTYYNFANVREITVTPETETTIASITFSAAQLTTVKILHEFIFNIIANLALECSYELKYYLDEELLPYGPYERIAPAITEPQPIDDNREIDITRDFFYILKEVTPNVRHTWEVKIIAHGVESFVIGVDHAHITIEGQRLYSDEYFDGYIEALDIIDTYGVGYLGTDDIYDSAIVSITDAVAESALDEFELCTINNIEVLSISEGSGYLAPHIFMEGGLYLMTESDDYFESEDGIRFVSE